MNPRPASVRSMRVRLLAGILLALALPGCGGGGKSRTVTTQAPAPTVTVTTPATTPTSTSPAAPAGYRSPKPGEGQIAVNGRVASGQTRKLGATSSDTAQYTYFELQPDDGSDPLRVAAAGDLDIDPAVRDAIIDPRCGGKLHGTFTVAAAPKRISAYDWELVSATLSNRCGGP